MSENILARKVRVVNSEGEQIGVMHLLMAQKLARQRRKDLVEIAPRARPPIYKLMSRKQPRT